MRKLLKEFRIAISGSEKTFTTGSIRRAIFLLSIPLIFEMAAESVFAIVDIYWVGQIEQYATNITISSEDAVATVGLTEAVMFLVYSLAIGLSMATTAMVARRVGEGNKEGAADAAIQSMNIAIVLSLFISLIGLFFAKDILRLMGGEPQLVEAGFGYTWVMLVGNSSIMFIFLINAIFRGAGDASIAMRSLLLANSLNLILDPCLIFGWGPFPEMGVQGAAIATTSGRAIGVGYQIFMLAKGHAIVRIYARHLRVLWGVIKNLFRVSIGGILQYIIGSASWLFLVRIISDFGSEAVAGYTIAIRVIIFSILPSWGMANAAATLVGQNLGAGQPDRAEQSVWKSSKYNMFFLLGLSIVFYILAPNIIALFNNNPEVLKFGVDSLRIMCAGYIFYAYGMVISQAFNGAGDTMTPTVINLFAFWLIQIPLAYSLARTLELGPNGVFIAMVISQSVLALTAIIVFRKGRWKTIGI